MNSCILLRIFFRYLLKISYSYLSREKIMAQDINIKMYVTYYMHMDIECDRITKDLNSKIAVEIFMQSRNDIG